MHVCLFSGHVTVITIKRENLKMIHSEWGEKNSLFIEWKKYPQLIHFRINIILMFFVPKIESGVTTNIVLAMGRKIVLGHKQ